MNQETSKIQRRVVFTAGYWDLLHDGHLDHLQRAKALGDILIVGVATDEFVRPGKNIPIWDFKRRCTEIARLPYVDIVVPHTAVADFTQILKHGVNIRAVGPDYPDRCPEIMVAQEKLGIEFVIITHDIDVSSTQIRKKGEL